MTPTTVLYIHGLESGPNGRKVRQLRDAGFTVVSELMPCGRAQIARDPMVIAGVSAAVAALAASAVVGGLAGLVVAAILLMALLPWARSRLTRRVTRRSIEVQKRALAEHAIDVVIGSSFGGAIALELLYRGLWSGPTVLLCPAHELLARRAWLPRPASLATLPAEVASGIVVIHGRGDETVPMAHSQALVEGSPAQLVLVEDGHRLAGVASPEQFTAWIARAGGQMPA